MTYRNDGQQLRRPPDVYLYTSVPHFDKQREVTGVSTYRRGLSTLFVPGSWHCEGLEHGTDEDEIPTPFLYIPVNIR
ncbi:hypothetical protein SFC43_21940 [Bacteroides sp. CR5/BHMF/2]|nr:hypothetical protein [Bacteroides sp. CR5/BHMF/2]